jgi:lipid-binding SYLF domain-containing protein
MKNYPAFTFRQAALFFTAFLIGIAATAQTSPKDKKLIEDNKIAKAAFIRVDRSMKDKFKKTYGYVIFPNVGKGGAGIGGAAGNGVAYQKGKMIGKAKMTQVTIGLQLGGQSYREVIFFENKSDLERFKENNFELAAQASAVAVKAGASDNVKYTDGVMIFTQTKGGLMVEASVGGQKFKFKKFWIVL